jgi:two-component system, response regulator YesN
LRAFQGSWYFIRVSGEQPKSPADEGPVRAVLRKYSLAIRLVAGFLVPAALAVVLITALLFVQYSTKAKEDLGRIQSLYLQGIRGQAENALTSASRLCYSLSLDQDARLAFGALPRDMLSFSQAATRINQLLIAYPYVGSIVFCAHNRVAYSTYAQNSFHESPADALAVVKGARQLSPISRYVIKRNGEIGHIVSFVYNVSNGPDYIDSAVIVNVDADSLASGLFASVVSGDGGVQGYAVIDKAGATLADSNWLSEGGMRLSPEQARRVSAQAQRSGAWKVRGAAGPAMLSYSKSEDGDYAAVSTVDYAAYMSGIRGVKSFTLILCGALLAAIIVVTSLVSLRLYMPIHGMFARISELMPDKEKPGAIGDRDYAAKIIAWTEGQLAQEASSGSAESRARTTLRAALTGSLGLDDAAVAEALAGAGLSLEGAALFVAIAGRAAWEGGETPKEESIAEIARLAQASLSRLAPTLASDLGRDCLVILCRFPGPSPLDGARLAAALRSFAEEASGGSGPSLSFGVGDAVPDASAIRQSFLAAARRNRGRVFRGPRAIAIDDGSEAPPEFERELRHRMDCLEELVVVGDRRRFEEEARGLVALSASAPIERGMECCLAAAKTVRSVGTRLSDQPLPSGAASLAEELEQLCGEEELVEWLLASYDRAHGVLERICKVAAADLVRAAIEYIDRSYADPLLSGTLVAERLSITPQYFSRIFNEHAGSSFPDYLKSVRLEKARGAIIDGSAPSLDAVCEASGFRNKAYFTTAFKQKYGVTPGKFRLSLRRPE